MQRAWGLAIAVLIFNAGIAAAQTGNRSSGRKQTPAAKANSFRRAVADFLAQRSRLQQQANSAFQQEMAREKVVDCPDARTTYAEEMCLSKAIQTTEASYKAFSGAIRALLDQKNPFVTNTDLGGPSGKSLPAESLVKEFDQTEAEWNTYRKTQCSAAYDLFKGGTIAPVMGGRCEIKLIRSRMTDLNSIYDMTLHH